MLRSYLNMAWKILLRKKFFAAVSLFGIGFTLLVLVVTASVIDHVFAARPPEVHARRTLGVYMAVLEGPKIQRLTSPGFLPLERYVRTLAQVEAVTIFTTGTEVNSYLGGSKIVSVLKRSDAQYWEILEFEFLEGGPFTADDEASGNFVAVITRATRERFFAHRSALGQHLEADGQRFRVVGVVENISRLREAPFADIWVPISTAKSSTYRHEFLGEFNALILARDRADFADIQAELRSRAASAEFLDPKLYTRFDFWAETPAESAAARIIGHRWERDASRLRVFLAMAVASVALFMLLPAVNLVNLNLSRVSERSSEIGVRKAFGASSRTLVGQLIVENVILTLLAALIALVVSAAVLRALNSSGLVPYAHFVLNLRVFACGLALAMVFALVSGAYPAWRMSRLHPAQALSGRSA